MGNVEIPSWLEGLPLAPVFRPTDTEFADPIAYISKIEKEASAFGICKIVPPLPKPSKKYVLGNLNKSLAKCPELGPDANLASARSLGKPGCRDNCIDGETKAVFTTRQQELGQSVKKPKGAGDNVHLGAQKQVWQSGEMYTLEQFEAKSKAFARSQLGMVKEVSAEVVEAMFWQAASEKPIYVEYANDVPGSGFGEQDGQLRYFHRRRRMRMDYLRQKKGSDGKNSEVGATNDSHGHGGETNVSCVGNHSSSETCKASMSQTGTLAEETSRPYHKSNSSNYELEGTAGWKLSNSPWNLQVIARSSGSLTRFMPDDIPGVTSPMVYIGMLFSWFAWHVEDHELHSMNFLHMGSPKTWYAVPGDYAYAFEEIIRKEAYGGSIDRLAALSLLGEKTTLLSPEVIVAAGIPCCRLIQNPGEFVVTFPRAYHIGFSHGFNCGEAANFATPQWLRFAKEAAVRRAAMNYLPMLSHQQLLYLLTMSFVARVPRSLIPGARTSRLRDRQREERELSVKKAFLEDILNENDLLLSLLGKKSTSRAVIWNPHLLPSQNKESRLPDGTVVSTSVGENLAQKYSEHANSSINLFKEMTMYMEALNGSYMDTDDLLFDFQVDSGTLACVACGILGFPFMSVIQPLDTASAAFLNTDHPPLQTCDDQQNVSDPASPPKQLPERSSDNSGKSFSTSDGLLRPRIFCLEHAIQIENILQSKGGANVLVICHSDYQKMKVYARSIAEEICLPFVYKEIPLDTAAEEDLKLIDLAIDDHDSVGCRDDWTTKLGINLQYCVKARKNSLLSRVQHALTLGGLISDESPGSTILNVKWKSRKSRSKSRIGNPEKCKPHEHLQMKDETISGGKWDIDTVKKEDRIIQYTRRNAKFKPGIAIGNSRVQGRTRKQPAAEVSLATDGEGYSYAKMQSEVGFDGTLDESRHEIQVLEAVGGLSLDLLPPQIARSPVGVTPYVGNVDVQVISEAPEKMDVETKAFSFSAGNTSERQREIELSHRPAEKNESLIDDDSCFADTAAGENLGLLRANGTAEAPFYNTLDLEAARVLRASSPPIGLHNEITLNCKVQDETPSSKVKESDNLRGSLIAHTEVTQHTASAELPESEACKIMCSKQDSSHNPLLDARNATQTGNENSEKKPTSQLSARMEANIEVAKDLTQNPKVQPETERLDEHGEKDVSIPMEETRLICSSVEECSEARTYSGEHMNKDGNLEGEIQRKNQIADQISDDNPALSSVTATTDFDQECSLLHRELNDSEDSRSADENSSSGDIMNCETMKAAVVNQSIGTGKKRKRKSEMEMVSGHFLHYSSFVRSPCEGLRPRAAKQAVKGSDDCIIKLREEKPPKKPREPRRETASSGDGGERTSTSHRCDIEGCRMKFKSKADLLMHKRNRCPVEGCRKKFRSHKYAILHQRVHDDDRPLKCPWKGCNMTFKWAWARTEHIRVHTGERPYKCKVEGCGLSFRFVSDFSRHRRKTGHYVS